MRRLCLLTISFFIFMISPAPAAVPHVVQPGESLWQIAAANNFTTRAFAAANGLSPDAAVIAGTTLKVPSVSEASVALQGAGIAPAAPGASAAAAPKPMGG